MTVFDDSTTERRSITGVALRWSHVILAIIVYLLTIGALYGELHFETTQNTRDIQDLKEHSVNREQQGEFQDEVKRRLDRIERKIDEEKSLRELH